MLQKILWFHYYILCVEFVTMHFFFFSSLGFVTGLLQRLAQVLLYKYKFSGPRRSVCTVNNNIPEVNQKTLHVKLNSVTVSQQKAPDPQTASFQRICCKIIPMYDLKPFISLHGVKFLLQHKPVSSVPYRTFIESQLMQID